MLEPYHTLLFRVPQRLFENRAETEELIQSRRLPDISAGAEPDSVGSISMSIRGAKDQNGYLAARLALTHAPQDFATRLFGKIEVKDNKIGASEHM